MAAIGRSATARRAILMSGIIRPARTLHQRDVVVLADSLKHKKGCRALAAVGDEMGAARLNGVALAGAQAHLFLRLLQEDAQLALEDVEGVAHVAVVVPGHLLLLRDPELLDAEAGARGVLRAV